MRWSDFVIWWVRGSLLWIDFSWVSASAAAVVRRVWVWVDFVGLGDSGLVSVANFGVWFWWMWYDFGGFCGLTSAGWSNFVIWWVCYIYCELILWFCGWWMWLAVFRTVGLKKRETQREREEELKMNKKIMKKEYLNEMVKKNRKFNVRCIVKWRVKCYKIDFLDVKC